MAERIATLDLISGGRVEFGTGESSSEAELGGFGIDREEKRAQWEEALDAVTRMLVEEPFAGYQGKFVEMPPRNVVPKPLQRPHPPLTTTTGAGTCSTSAKRSVPLRLEPEGVLGMPPALGRPLAPRRLAAPRRAFAGGEVVVAVRAVDLQLLGQVRAVVPAA